MRERLMKKCASIYLVEFRAEVDGVRVVVLQVCELDDEVHHPEQHDDRQQDGQQVQPQIVHGAESDRLLLHESPRQRNKRSGSDP